MDAQIFGSRIGDQDMDFEPIFIRYRFSLDINFSYHKSTENVVRAK